MAGDDLGLIDDGVVAATNGRITYAGPTGGAPTTEAQVHDCEGRLITPGLIDCHTHLIHGGNRANEWAMRLQGASYEEIARAGGGIVSTMRATRAASDDEERKSVVEGKSGSVRVDIGGRRIIKQKKKNDK